MKYTLSIGLLFFTLFFSCSNPDQKVKISKISKNTDPDFNEFIMHFSKDSLFQISRIVFPLKQIVIDENDHQIQTLIQKTEFNMMDFMNQSAEKRGFDQYKNTIKVNGNKATIETRGIDNGIYIDTFFEKKNGKWMLVSSTDSST